MKNFKKHLLLLMIAIVGLFSALYAEQSIPRGINMPISNLLFSQESFDAFLADYSEYQLQLVSFCSHHKELIHYCTNQGFIFNSYFLSEDEMIGLLSEDPRVGNPFISCRNGSSFRTFSIELVEGINEKEFIESYSQYRFRGSLPHMGIYKRFTFGVNLIYPIDFLEILKSDPRVNYVRITLPWGAGVIRISADRDFSNIADEFLESYSHFGELRWRNTMILPNRFLGELVFDYVQYNEFLFLNELRNDERINIAEFNHFIGLRCRPNIFVSQYDETIRPMTMITVYPNPVRGDFVKFQAKSYDTRDIDQFEFSIYNIRGQRIFLSNEFQTENGNINFVWNNRDNNNQPVASGVYLYRANINNNTHTGRLLILK